MIVLDECLHDQRYLASIAAWYPGRVTSITLLRGGELFEDDAIPVLLRELDAPTFVTINVDDFWRKVVPHSAYCIVGIDLPKERAREVPAFLRRLLRVQAFRTKSARLGTVVRLTPTLIEYYTADKQIHALEYPRY